MTQPIYRFKFAPNFQLALEVFANTHRFDDISHFRKSWDRWCDANTSLIEEEERRLKILGYKKIISIKMYKSVRYYFKNKSLTKKKPIKRRVYISLRSELLEDMSRHITMLISEDSKKPAYAYNNFIGNSEYNTHLHSEEQRLIKEFNMSEVEIEAKIKKTYKNRYFIYQQKHKTK